eukprot:CAMPEP_0113723374 /NCGR_PEP_ID=MMETSP0038_2-20120614/38383_1 /TAXON_ID=2898 /ORGANISM="Cryptomonas paramecium" /LENGTH=31 /DNA_ID=CAMNT_0000652947 /DNA_START=66 /DNA_END=157 /DNA_ORIENTATION=- /assembly_acc=CAM_ASM_000170
MDENSALDLLVRFDIMTSAERPSVQICPPLA